MLSLARCLAAFSLVVFAGVACRTAQTPVPSGSATPSVERSASGRMMIWPARLAPGDTIAFIAPAGDLDRERMALARQRLEARGYRVVQRDDLFAQEGYLAGSDERRAAELMEAFADPEVDAIFPGTGGYGTMRILDHLDYAFIRAHPKLVIGFSDITGLHAALNRRAGLVTYHSPNPMWGLGSPDGLAPFAERWFFRALETSAGAGPYQLEIPATFEAWPALPTPPSSPAPALPASPAPPAVTSTENSGGAKLQPFGAWGQGTARGRLVGGNLSLISALEGTPYALDTRGAILLIEDVREAPYRIDRMLRQLQLAGKLAELKGAVLGQFTRNYDREDETRRPDPRYTVEGVLEQYFAGAGIPVLHGFPLGHIPFNATLPLGGLVEVDADHATLRVLEGEATVWLGEAPAIGCAQPLPAPSGR